MSKQQITKTHNAVVNALKARAQAAIDVDNKSLHDKFMTEAKLFTTDYAALLVEQEISIKFVDSIAIYAMQKVRKILHTIAHSDKLDKYTRVVVNNAQASKRKQSINNREQSASMCSALEVDTMSAKDERLQKAASTASTQSSSTRKALTALNIASYDSDSKTLSFNEDSELYKQLLIKTKKAA